MRRVVFTTAASVAVLALAPASALASHHHKRHHGRAHHARVHHARVRRFGDVSSTSATTPPSAMAATAVGTVDTFTNGVLTIKLNDGSTVSGAVTNDTEIECQMAQSTGTVHEDGDGGGGGGDQGGGDNQGGNGGNDNGGGDDQGEQNQNCTSANLTMGAMVGGAELRFSSAGATWDKVDLIG